MLRVLYKVGVPSEKRPPSLEGGAKQRPKAESGAQSPAAKQPSGAERLKAHRKLEAEKATARREEQEKVKALQDRLTGAMSDDEQMQTWRTLSRDSRLKDRSEDIVGDLLADEAERTKPFTTGGMSDDELLQTWRNASKDSSLKDRSEDQVADLLREEENDRAWSAQHLKNVEALTGYRSDASRDEVAEGISDMQRMEAERVERESAPEISSDFLEDDEDTEPVFPLSRKKNRAPLSVDQKTPDSVPVMGEKLEAIMTEVRAEQADALLPELPVNATKSQIEAAQRKLVEGFANQAKTALRKELLLRSGLKNVESDVERSRTEAAIAQAQSEAEAKLALEFFAEHENPRAAQQHYDQIRNERIALLQNSEAREVLERLNSKRGDDTWENGKYIKPIDIQEFSNPEERALARRWHAIEKAQAELASGVNRLREHHETRVKLTELQVDAIQGGNWASKDLLNALKTPGLNQENATDQVFSDLHRFDVPTTSGERAVAAIMNFDIGGMKPGRAIMEFFGRKYANVTLNEAARVIEPIQEQMRVLDSERNLGKGIVLGTNNIDMGAVSNVTNFSAATRSAEMGGRGYTNGSRSEGGDVAITQEAANDLQGIIDSARKVREGLDGRNRNNAYPTREAIQGLVQSLEANLAKYENTPTARSRAYDIAQQDLEALRARLGNFARGARNKQETKWEPIEADLGVNLDGEQNETWEPIEADLGVDWDDKTEKQIYDMSAEATLIEEVDAALEKNVDRLSSAQLEKIDHATEVLMSSQRSLQEALAKGEPVGRMFIDALQDFMMDRQGTLRLLKLNRLDQNPAAQDLTKVLKETAASLREYRFLEASPKAYRAIAKGLEAGKRLQANLDSPSALFNASEMRYTLQVIDAALTEDMPGSSAFKALTDLRAELLAKVSALDFADADLPVAGMSPERRTNLVSATTETDRIAAEMQSSNLRANKGGADVAANGTRYRKAIQDARGTLLKTPRSMQGSAQAQALQASLLKAENRYQLWAKRNGERALTNVDTSSAQ